MFNLGLDPCRTLGGTKSGHDRPLPLHLQQNLTKFRQTWGRKRPTPHRASPSTLGASCVCRYLLAHGYYKHSLAHEPSYPFGKHLIPKPRQWYELQIEDIPFACFVDPAEAYSYAKTLSAIDSAKTAVFSCLKV